MVEKMDTFEIITRAPDQLGQALERFRDQKKLSQASLAKSAGMRQATVSKVEQGSGTTEVNTIFSLCAALGLEIVLRERPVKNENLKMEDLFK